MGTSSKYLAHRVIPNIVASGINLEEDVTAVNTVKAF